MNSRKSVFLNAARVDPLVAAAGLSHEAFCQRCGISSVTFSRLRHGQPARTSTLAKIARGLVGLKPMKGFEGLDGVVTSAPATDDKNIAEASSLAPAIAQEVRPDGRPAPNATARHPIMFSTRMRDVYDMPDVPGTTGRGGHGRA
jgi:transcriptional regulator with XRE-family HTH domain